MELISKDDVIKALQKWNCRDYDSQTINPYEVLRDIPIIEERKEGEWIFKTVFPNDKSEFPMGYLVCSVCGSHHSNSTPCNYCDNCGAKMKGE